MYQFYTALNSSSIILIALAIILTAGFLFTRITKRLRLPNVTGYILAGILIGPCALNLIPPDIITHTDFISDIALAFIAFGVGQFFKKQVVKEVGAQMIVITVFEALAAGILVTFTMRFLFQLSWSFSFILGAVSTATAPASTMMTIRQYQAKGDFVNSILMVVALDDVVCLLVFSIVTSIINANEAGASIAKNIFFPFIYNIAALIMGWLLGVLLGKLLSFSHNKDHELILLVAMLLTISGICSIFDISPLLTCMLFGATYANISQDDHLFDLANEFSPPIMSLFFIRSGMSLDLSSLLALGAVGVAYFIVRIVGKYIGSYLGCLLMHTKKETRNYLGLALVPQAGVAIGLAFLGQRILPEAAGNFLITIILASSVLYELMGPACAKLSLVLAGAIKKEPSTQTVIAQDLPTEAPACAQKIE